VRNEVFEPYRDRYSFHTDDLMVIDDFIDKEREWDIKVAFESICGVKDFESFRAGWLASK